MRDPYYDVAALSASGINKFITKSPAHYWAESPLNPNRTVREDTDSMILGRVIHKMIFEDDFDKEYVVEISKEDYPEALVTVDDIKEFIVSCGETPKGKKKADYILQAKSLFEEVQIFDEVCERALASANGRTVISKKMHTEASILSKTVLSDVVAKQLIKSGSPELPLSWNNGIIPCKAKLDYYRDGLIIDYKSSTCADLDGFEKTIVNYGYHRQAAWYMDAVQATYGEKPLGFVFIVQDKSLPEAIGVYHYLPDDDAIQKGRRENMRAAERIAARMENGDWRAFPAKMIQIGLPTWYKEWELMNREVAESQRGVIRELLLQCTQSQQDFFIRIYKSVEEIKWEDLDIATNLIKRTIKKNEAGR